MDRSTQIRAMASPARMTILRLLADQKGNFGQQYSADPAEFGICMTLIAGKMGVTQPTVSRHLDILRQAGFIVVKRQHKWSYCRRNEIAIHDYLDWLRNELAGPVQGQ